MSFLWFHRFCLITLNIISTHMTQILYTSQLGSRKQAGVCLTHRTRHYRFPVCDASSPERLSQTHWSLLTSSVQLSSSHSNDAASLTCAHCLFSPSNLFDFKAYCSIGVLCCSSYCLGCTDWNALVLTVAVFVRCIFILEFNLNWQREVKKITSEFGGGVFCGTVSHDTFTDI